MPEVVPKTPLSVPELATRAATYGALFLVGSSLLVTMLWFNDGQTKRVERVSIEVSDVRHEVADLRKEVQVLRQDVNDLRVEFVEFRAETRAEFKSLHTDIDEIKALLKAR